MNKIAQQFQNDVVTRYQQKMAELVKKAEDNLNLPTPPIEMNWLERLADPESAKIVDTNNDLVAKQDMAKEWFNNTKTILDAENIDPDAIRPTFTPRGNGDFYVDPHFVNNLEQYPDLTSDELRDGIEALNAIESISSNPTDAWANAKILRGAAPDSLYRETTDMVQRNRFPFKNK